MPVDFASVKVAIEESYYYYYYCIALCTEYDPSPMRSGTARVNGGHTVFTCHSQME